MLNFTDVIAMLDPTEPAAAGRVWGYSLAASASTKLDHMRDVQRIDAVRKLKNCAAEMVDVFAAQFLTQLGFEAHDIEIYRASALEAFGLALEGRSVTHH